MARQTTWAPHNSGRLKAQKKVLVHQPDDGVAFLESNSESWGAFAGSREPSRDGTQAQALQNWPDRGTIPENVNRLK
jgi:hypothetical protein